MRTLLFLTALLAAAPAMAGHRSDNVDRSHATATRAQRGAPAANRSSRTQSRANTRAVQTRTAPRHVQTARPGPRTHHAPVRRVQQAPARHHRVQTRRVVHRDPWARGYRANVRPGYVWIDGGWDHGGWHPGYYRPVHARAGHTWVPGYWNGFTYVEGYWRPANRRGYVWVGGYYSGRTWVRGYWDRAPRVHRYNRGVVYR